MIQGLTAFLLLSIADSGPKRVKDLVAVMEETDTDDEGEIKPLPVGGIQRIEGGVVSGVELIQAEP